MTVADWWKEMVGLSLGDLKIWFILVAICFVWGLITYYVDILRGKR